MLNTLLTCTLFIWSFTFTVSLFCYLGNVTHRYLLYTAHLLFIVAALTTIGLGWSGLTTTGAPPVHLLPLTWLGSHPDILLTPISSFFVLMTGFTTLGVSLFSVTYYHDHTPQQQHKIQCLQICFIAAMLLVFTANSPLLFLFAWEGMTFASYFLVMNTNAHRSTRKAGLMYLGIAHVGFFAISIAFFGLFPTSSIFTAHLNQTLTALTPSHATIFFSLALLGFGAKAGLFPLHIWLPEAHPAAPSPISALMSGVMLKTAVYGLFQFSFHFLLPYQQTSWGYALIGLGLITMVAGVIHAALQTDMKRLLAYSSMENLGLICTALGLAIVLYQYHNFLLADLALLVVLLHTLNHSVFKSLLFLVSGSLLHATGERQFTKLGGLIHLFPWISAFALIGCLAMAGLPFFNGFLSEWLYLNIFFHYHMTHPFTLAALSPVLLGLSVFVFGLAGFVVVKFFGITFLGQARGSVTAYHRLPSSYEKCGLGWLAALCLLLGIWPQSILHAIQHALAWQLAELPSALQLKNFGLQFTTPALTHHALNPLTLILGITSVLLVCCLIVRRCSKWPIRRTHSWDCGFPHLTARMQDSAEGFSQPFKQIFSHLISLTVRAPKPDETRPYYTSHISEKIWPLLYLPLLKGIARCAALTRWLQQGRVSTYLLYMAITLFILLMWAVI